MKIATNTVMRHMNALIGKGYASVSKNRAVDGTFEAEYVIYETPREVQSSSRQNEDRNQSSFTGPVNEDVSSINQEISRGEERPASASPAPDEPPLLEGLRVASRAALGAETGHEGKIVEVLLLRGYSAAEVLSGWRKCLADAPSKARWFVDDFVTRWAPKTPARETASSPPAPSPEELQAEKEREILEHPEMAAAAERAAVEFRRRVGLPAPAKEEDDQEDDWDATEDSGLDAEEDDWPAATVAAGAVR
jgi:hypothetical protein